MCLPPSLIRHHWSPGVPSQAQPPQREALFWICSFLLILSHVYTFLNDILFTLPYFLTVLQGYPHLKYLSDFLFFTQHFIIYPSGSGQLQLIHFPWRAVRSWKDYSTICWSILWSVETWMVSSVLQSRTPRRMSRGAHAQADPQHRPPCRAAQC